MNAIFNGKQVCNSSMHICTTITLKARNACQAYNHVKVTQISPLILQSVEVVCQIKQEDI